MVWPARRRDAAVPFSMLLGLLVQFLVLEEVGPAAIPTPLPALPPNAWAPVAPTAALIKALRHHHAMAVSRVRGGGGSFDATPPLLATPGLVAADDDETEELVVNSPGTQVLPTAPGGHGWSEYERSRRTEERAPASLARAQITLPQCSIKPGARAWGAPPDLAAPQGLMGVGRRAHVSLRSDTPVPVRRGAAREPEQRAAQACGTGAMSIDERMQLLETTLSERTSDWSQRVRALKDLHAIMNTLSPTHLADASGGDPRANVLLRIIPGLCTQLQDKRSSLVKEVCSTLNDIAKMLGDSFEPAAAKLVPALLSLTFVTVRVISVAAW